MQRFFQIFSGKKCPIFGVIHVPALPGCPNYQGNFKALVAKCVQEAEIYSRYKMDAIIIENMHDVPYVQNNQIGPEIIASMARVATEVKKVVSKEMPCGIQILACGNKQALAVAKACDFQFIRVEGFVFSHIADEGFTDACAGELLRYRKNIDAENVLVLTDIKKKHSSHSITADTSLLETIHAAELFQTDGVIITGKATGQAASLEDLVSIHGRVNTPILIGSGVDLKNIRDFFPKVDGLIVGSHFKKDGHWRNDLSESRIETYMEKMKELRGNL